MSNFKANTSNDMKIRKGQAFNLAVAVSCAANKQDDNEYIMKQFLRMMELSSLVQKATPQQLAEALECEETLELLQSVSLKIAGE